MSNTKQNISCESFTCGGGIGPSAAKPRSKRNFFGFAGAVFVSQVPVSFHAQCAAILVSEPARNGRDVHAGFNAAGGKQMA